jgi:hypothetical protein
VSNPVLAGKADPKDGPGQALIREWTRFVRRSDVRSHVVFLSDYDMLLAERLVEGIDVWINTPKSPWEARGTSGMKVLVNGGLNLSVLDGWWAEAYSPGVGWAIGDGNEHGDDPAWDRADAEALYAALENEIIPEFYNRDEKGIPRARGRAHTGEYGAAYSGIFRQSHGPAVHRGTLSPCCGRLCGARREEWKSRSRTFRMAQRNCPALERRSLRHPTGHHARWRNDV